MLVQINTLLLALVIALAVALVSVTLSPPPPIISEPHAATDQNTDAKNTQGHPAKSLWIPEDSTGFFTLWVALFTGVLALWTVRLYGATRDAALAAQRQATIAAAVEGPMPLILGFNIVQYAQIPGEIAVTDPVRGPIPANCRILFCIENKGRTPLRLFDLCIEKFAGLSLPDNPVYSNIIPWGLVLEKGPIWIRPSEEQAVITPAEIGRITAAYPQGAFWVYGYFTYTPFTS